MKKLLITFTMAMIGIIFSSTVVGATTLLDRCPTVVITAEKEYTREEVLQQVYEQTEELKRQNKLPIINSNSQASNDWTNNSGNGGKWTIINNNFIKK